MIVYGVQTDKRLSHLPREYLVHPSDPQYGVRFVIHFVECSKSKSVVFYLVWFRVGLKYQGQNLFETPKVCDDHFYFYRYIELHGF